MPPLSGGRHGCYSRIHGANRFASSPMRSGSGAHDVLAHTPGQAGAAGDAAKLLARLR